MRSRGQVLQGNVANQKVANGRRLLEARSILRFSAGREEVMRMAGL